jgi:hypothetical protein
MAGGVTMVSFKIASFPSDVVVLRRALVLVSFNVITPVATTAEATAKVPATATAVPTCAAVDAAATFEAIVSKTPTGGGGPPTAAPPLATEAEAF